VLRPGGGRHRRDLREPRRRGEERERARDGEEHRRAEHVEDLERGAEETSHHRTKSRNSARVRASLRNVPRSELVTALEFCFSTPRIIMQRCCASITTPTPRGASRSKSAEAIWFVNRSCTCSLLAKTSTRRGIFDSPMIRPRGR